MWQMLNRTGAGVCGPLDVFKNQVFEFKWGRNRSAMKNWDWNTAPQLKGAPYPPPKSCKIWTAVWTWSSWKLRNVAPLTKPANKVRAATADFIQILTSASASARGWHAIDSTIPGFEVNLWKRSMNVTSTREHTYTVIHIWLLSGIEAYNL
jgi:hypothetical protein